MKISSIKKEFLFHCSIDRKLAKNTVEAYRHDLSSFLAYIGDGEIEKKLTTKTLKGYLSEILEIQNLSPATAKRRIACLRAFCSFAESKHLSKNPFQDWTPSIKKPKKLPRALTENEVSQLVCNQPALSKTDQETVFCTLLLSATGLRVSELCAIKAQDVSSDGSSIHINGKGSKERIVYIGNNKLQEELVFRRSERIESHGINGNLLLNSRQMPLRPQTLRIRLHRLRSNAAIERRITPHMLRHTAATLLIEAGTDIRFVQRLLGHASIATTEIYTKVSDKALRHAICKADTVGNLVSQS